MHTTHSRRERVAHRAHQVLTVIAFVYLALCVPDLYERTSYTLRHDQAAATLETIADRLGDGDARGALDQLVAEGAVRTDGNPYTRGVMRAEAVGPYETVLTTRTGSGQARCLIRFSDGQQTTLHRSWEDGMTGDCPPPRGWPLPTRSALGADVCQTAPGTPRCWLAQTEAALWRCTRAMGSPEPCVEPGVLRSRGGLASDVPLAERGVGQPPALNTVVVNTSAAMEGVVSYAIAASDATGAYALTYYSAEQSASQLTCEPAAVCPAAATRRAL